MQIFCKKLSFSALFLDMCKYFCKFAAIFEKCNDERTKTLFFNGGSVASSMV